MTKLRIGVLYGGQHPGPDVSYDAAVAVLAHLNRERFDPVPVRITADGRWRVAAPDDSLGRGQALKPKAPAARSAALTSAMKALAGVDVVLPVLHGTPDEDSTVRGLLDLLAVPYVGRGVAAGVVGMDKAFTRAVLRAEGIKVADAVVLRSPGETVGDSDRARLGLPLLVKPSCGNPGDGVTRVDDATALDAAVAEAFRFDAKVLVERAVPGQEISISVLQHPDGRLVASPPVHPEGDAGQGPVVPLEPALCAALDELAIRAFRILGCTGLARINFLVDTAGGRTSVVLHEVDARPVLVPGAPDAAAWSSAGLPYTGLLDVLIDTGLARRGSLPVPADAALPKSHTSPSSLSPVVRPETGITVFSCAPDEAVLFREMAPHLGVVTTITEEHVSEANASLAAGNRCVSVGHKSRVTNATLLALSRVGVRYISTRSVGFDHIDITYAQSVGITVGNVFYSPDSVADYTIMQMLMLLRDAKSTIHRTDEHDYRLHEVRGKELRDLTVGVVGTGRIGTAVIDRLHGFGCRILARDSSPATAAAQIPLDILLQQSDIVTLHTPLNASTHHLLNSRNLGQAKKGAFIVNTGRGALIDTAALVSALENGKLGGAALDVIEGEAGIFYADCRDRPVENKLLLRLQEMPNVLISPHTAYYTDRALSDTVENSIINCLSFESENRRG